MKERPILFSAPMVRAILEGRKTQTRRVVKPIPQMVTDKSITTWEGDAAALMRLFDQVGRACPYGQPGDRMWVRETWQGPLIDDDLDSDELPRNEYEKPEFCQYAADGGPTPEFMTEDDELVRRWRPSIHMPRWASRITLEITGVRVQRLHEISEEDAIAEGVHPAQGMRGEDDLMVHQVVSAHEGLAGGLGTFPFPKARFVLLWDSINGKYPNNWNANPWVWAIEFKRVEAAR